MIDSGMSRNGVVVRVGNVEKHVLEHGRGPGRGSSKTMLGNGFFHFPVLCLGGQT